MTRAYENAIVANVGRPVIRKVIIQIHQGEEVTIAGLGKKNVKKSEVLIKKDGKSPSLGKTLRTANYRTLEQERRRGKNSYSKDHENLISVSQTGH